MKPHHVSVPLPYFPCLCPLKARHIFALLISNPTTTFQHNVNEVIWEIQLHPIIYNLCLQPWNRMTLPPIGCFGEHTHTSSEGEVAAPVKTQATLKYIWLNTDDKLNNVSTSATPVKDGWKSSESVSRIWVRC